MLQQWSAHENPFCTRRTRPGALAYCFPPGVNVGDLIELLRSNQWQGEIVGPHGSGKSTLLAQILPAIKQASRQPVLIELHNAQRRLPSDWRGKTESAAISAPVIIVVDGYEQLSRLSRFCLKRYCRRGHLGLLVTSHVTVGLPEIFRTDCSLEMTQQLVAQLMQNQQVTIPAGIIAELFSKHHGNIREILFDLYDLYEKQQTDLKSKELFL